MADTNDSITYDILSLIQTKKHVSDKEIFHLKEQYIEHEFLKSFNELVENRFIEPLSLPRSESSGLAGIELSYQLTPRGKQMLRQFDYANNNNRKSVSG